MVLWFDVPAQWLSAACSQALFRHCSIQTQYSPFVPHFEVQRSVVQTTTIVDFVFGELQLFLDQC
ncbi:hypothetical protein D3C71_1813730 [compost metagenome]